MLLSNTYCMSLIIKIKRLILNKILNKRKKVFFLKPRKYELMPGSLCKKKNAILRYN
jgi:hypothetical protein